MGGCTRRVVHVHIHMGWVVMRVDELADLLQVGVSWDAMLIHRQVHVSVRLHIARGATSGVHRNLTASMLGHVHHLPADGYLTHALHARLIGDANTHATPRMHHNAPSPRWTRPTLCARP